MKGIIRLCYRKVIDDASTGVWEKYVFEDTYKEFFIQAQQFDQGKEYTSFQEIVKNVPKADRMHYLVSTAAVGYLRQLNELVPDVVNPFGKPCIPFKNFRFEIIQSHVKNKERHKVAIHFYSEPLNWIDTVHDQILFAKGDQADVLAKGNEAETEMVTLRPELSVSMYSKIDVLIPADALKST